MCILVTYLLDVTPGCKEERYRVEVMLDSYLSPLRGSPPCLEKCVAQLCDFGTMLVPEDLPRNFSFTGRLGKMDLRVHD